MASFTVKIKLGNAAMQTAGDVADALRKVADKVGNGHVEGRVVDLNGLVVGEFKGVGIKDEDDER